MGCGLTLPQMMPVLEKTPFQGESLGNTLTTEDRSDFYVKQTEENDCKICSWDVFSDKAGKDKVFCFVEDVKDITLNDKSGTPIATVLKAGQLQQGVRKPEGKKGIDGHETREGVKVTLPDGTFFGLIKKTYNWETCEIWWTITNKDGKPMYVTRALPDFEKGGGTREIRGMKPDGNWTERPVAGAFFSADGKSKSSKKTDQVELLWHDKKMSCVKGVCPGVVLVLCMVSYLIEIGKTEDSDVPPRRWTMDPNFWMDGRAG